MRTQSANPTRQQMRRKFQRGKLTMKIKLCKFYIGVIITEAKQLRSKEVMGATYAPSTEAETDSTSSV
jgi:hypothetical protein